MSLLFLYQNLCDESSGTVCWYLFQEDQTQGKVQVWRILLKSVEPLHTVLDFSQAAGQTDYQHKRQKQKNKIK